MGRTIVIFLQFKDTRHAVRNAKIRNGLADRVVFVLCRTYDSNSLTATTRACVYGVTPYWLFTVSSSHKGEVKKEWNGRRKNAQETCAGKNIGKTPISPI